MTVIATHMPEAHPGKLCLFANNNDDDDDEEEMEDNEKRQHDDWANTRTNRLPSFTEVLSRKTRPPVDLFMF